jgi:hypothetical protein
VFKKKKIKAERRYCAFTEDTNLAQQQCPVCTSTTHTQHHQTPKFLVFVFFSLFLASYASCVWIKIEGKCHNTITYHFNLSTLISFFMKPLVDKSIMARKWRPFSSDSNPNNTNNTKPNNPNNLNNLNNPNNNNSEIPKQIYLVSGRHGYFINTQG